MTSRRRLIDTVKGAISLASGSQEGPGGVNGWRAWYTGGRTFSSSGRRWIDLPSKGALGVVVYHEEPYRSLIYGGDWYWLDGGQPTTGATKWGGWVEPPDVPPRELKRGAGVDDDTMEHVEQEMMDAVQWP